jgi:hypothetical protein
MVSSELVRDLPLDDGHSLKVWREAGKYNGQSVMTYRKVWQGPLNTTAPGWLSWGLHENFLLTLLAGRGVSRTVTTIDLHKEAHCIELLTLDAGPELQRDWIQAYPHPWPDKELVKLAYHSLVALVQIHKEGVVHGDLKSDNICVSSIKAAAVTGIDWQSLKLIDFAFSLCRDFPLQFVLPIDTEKIDYLPQFYKSAILNSRQFNQPQWVHKKCCAEIDLYSLGVMLQQLAQPSNEAYPGTMALIQECMRVGEKPQGWQWPQKKFEAQTTRLAQTALEWLNGQGLKDEIGHTILDLPKKTTATPLRNLAHKTAQPTPLLPTLPTPLIAKKLADSPITDGNLAEVSLAQTSAKNRLAIESIAWVKSFAKVLWVRLRWLGFMLMFLIGFAAVNQGYQSTELRLSDAGYALALVAIACAVPLGACALFQLSKPSAKGELLCLGLALVVMFVGLFHGLSLWLYGLNNLQAAQIATPWILAIALSLKRPRDPK